MDDVDRTAAMQHGLVTAAQAVELLGRGRKERWTAAGRLIAVQPRVYRLLGSPVTWHQELKAAQLSSRGLVSHRSSAEMWGMRRPAGALDLADEARRQPRLWGPVVVHRLVDLADAEAVERQGLDITDPVRTIIDLGLVVPPAAVAAAIEIGLARRLLRIADLRQLRLRLSRCGRDGVGIVGQLLDERWPEEPREESVLEHRFTELLERHGVVPPAVQYEVWHGGRFVARVDFAYPALRIAIELDGFEHHTSMEAFQHDRARQNELVALGWTILRFTWQDVERRPGAVVSSVRTAYQRLQDSVCA
jgi:hypothetical protein